MWLHHGGQQQHAGPRAYAGQASALEQQVDATRIPRLPFSTRTKESPVLMVSRITPRQVQSLMTKGEPVQFVDARGEPTWAEAAEQVSGAVRVRLTSLTRDATRVSRGCQVVVYGADDAEVHVARVADHLRILGFSHVRILSGGFAAWREQQLPVQLKPAALA
jgi:rhodanese-related sulfurtransferase